VYSVYPIEHLFVLLVQIYINILYNRIFLFFSIFAYMSYGEITKQDVLVQSVLNFNPETAPVEENPFKTCCYELNVFADSGNSSALRNDNSNIVKIIPKQYTITMRLQKFVSGSWVNQDTLTNDTYGTYYAQGFATKDNNDYVGYALSWRLVLAAYGIGRYRIAFDAAASGAIYSEEYCLRNFTQQAVDGSVRIKYLWNSVIGDKDQSKQRDFVGLNWWNEIRIAPAIFGNKKGTYEVETVRYQNGKERAVKKSFKEEYLLLIKQLPSDLHDVMMNDILLADEISITDYNKINASSFVNQEVEISGGYEPDYSNGKALPDVSVTFTDKYDNRRKLYS